MDFFRNNLLIFNIIILMYIKYFVNRLVDVIISMFKLKKKKLFINLKKNM